MEQIKTELNFTSIVWHSLSKEEVTRLAGLTYFGNIVEDSCIIEWNLRLQQESNIIGLKIEVESVKLDIETKTFMKTIDFIKEGFKITTTFDEDIRQMAFQKELEIKPATAYIWLQDKEIEITFKLI
jgi:hypothetical protein